MKTLYARKTWFRYLTESKGFPNAGPNPNTTGMRRIYGKDAFLVMCRSFLFNVDMATYTMLEEQEKKESVFKQIEKAHIYFTEEDFEPYADGSVILKRIDMPANADIDFASIVCSYPLDDTEAWSFWVEVGYANGSVETEKYSIAKECEDELKKAVLRFAERV